MKVYSFNVNVSLFSPTRLAGADSIKQILGVKAIPAAMKPLLRQAAVPSDIVNPLNAIKASQRRFLLKNGTNDPLLSWIIAEENIQDVVTQTEQLKTDFYALKQAILSDYPAVAEKHLNDLLDECQNDPAMKGIDCEAFIGAVRRTQPTLEYLEKQLQFTYLKPRAVELDPEEAVAVREGVYAQAIHEVAVRAREAIIPGKGKKPAQPKAQTRAAHEIRKKLKGLSYIVPEMSAIESEMAQVLAGIPTNLRNKDYTPVHTAALSGMLFRLSDEEGFMASVDRGETLFPHAVIEEEPMQETLLPEHGQVEVSPEHEQVSNPVELREALKDMLTENAASETDEEPLVHPVTQAEPDTKPAGSSYAW